jgi:hypothetical protein
MSVDRDEQGDQFGRIFVDTFFETYKSRQKFLGTFFPSKSHALILTKMGWATFWVIFFINSFGHPGDEIERGRQRERKKEKILLKHLFSKATTVKPGGIQSHDP